MQCAPVAAACIPVRPDARACRYRPLCRNASAQHVVSTKDSSARKWKPSFARSLSISLRIHCVVRGLSAKHAAERGHTSRSEDACSNPGHRCFGLGRLSSPLSIAHPSELLIQLMSFASCTVLRYGSGRLPCTASGAASSTNTSPVCPASAKSSSCSRLACGGGCASSSMMPLARQSYMQTSSRPHTAQMHPFQQRQLRDQQHVWGPILSVRLVPELGPWGVARGLLGRNFVQPAEQFGL